MLTSVIQKARAWFPGSVLWAVILFLGFPILRAMNKATGETIAEIELPAIPQGAPMTYMVDGKQYIAISCGGGAAAKMVTLSLPSAALTEANP